MVAQGRSREIIVGREILVEVRRKLDYRLSDLEPRLKRDLSVLLRWSRIPYQDDGRRVNGEGL
jgi:hypothetical protein